ncbi:MAG: amidohydrolase [Chloroflexi bacterium]|nr:amidohydrolase [Dehalococcoidia bacterium]MCO5201850.1 amidohydrolase [Chloroflexota bacterium]
MEAWPVAAGGTIGVVNWVDAHTHLFSPSQREARGEIAERDRTFAEMYGSPEAKMATVAELLGALDAAEIRHAVVAGFAFADERDIEEQNAYLAEAQRCSRGRVAVVATVNPGLAGWERRARQALDAGAVGFGELRPHNQGWEPLEPAGRALCGLARDAGAVLLWHVSEPVGHGYPGKEGGISPVELCRVATEFPGVKMVGAHLGGGLAYYLQMPEVKAAIENVYFDTAAATLLYDEQSVARLVDLAGPGRVIFGSDYPLLSPRRQLQRLLGQLPGDVAKQVCGGNAERLFRIATTHE